MTVQQESHYSQYIKSSFSGVVRGFGVQLFVHPLNVIKTSRQDLSTEKSYRIFLRLLQKEGVQGLYRGFWAQMGKISLKQIWCWPIITEGPYWFEGLNSSPLTQQMLLGVVIATIDAVSSSPLERVKILLITKGKNPLSLKTFHKEGWRGLSYHWMKSAVSWSSFLVFQKYFRDNRLKTENKKKLTGWDIVDIGTRVALLTTLIAAPFDLAHTLKQSQDLSIRTYLFSKQRQAPLSARRYLPKLYVGSSLALVASIIQNIASVIVINENS